jgi:REP element-mobilizing transposase RayT
VPQSLSAVYLHAIFSTKNREPWLLDRTLQDETHAFLGNVSNKLDCPPVIVGGVADHVHILARLGRTITQSDWIKELKRVSSLWLKDKDPLRMAGFAWQAGFGVFSVSPSMLESVEKYIHGQEEHHRKLTFQYEFRQFLEKHRMTWDERYLWE